MNNIEEIMNKLVYLNQYARVLKEDEKIDISISSYLIKEEVKVKETKSTDGSLVTVKTTTERVIYFKDINKIKVESSLLKEQYRDNERCYKKKFSEEPMYFDFQEKKNRYFGVDIDVEKVKEIRDYHFTAKELYLIKNELIEILYKLGFFNVTTHKKLVSFEYDETIKFHAPVSKIDYLDAEILEEYEREKFEWEDEAIIRDGWIPPEERKHRSHFPSEILITPLEVYKLRETVRNLAKPSEVIC